MSKLHGFNMFQLQEGGFTKAFVIGCRELLDEKADNLLELIDEDDGDALDRSNYESTISYLKDNVADIGKCRLFLSAKHIEFLDEQSQLVKDLCAYGVLDQSFHYSHCINFGRLLNTHSEFIRHYEECKQGIDRMAASAAAADDWLTCSLYDEYKSALVAQITFLKEQNNAFVNILLEEHVYNKPWDVLKRLREEFPTAKTKLLDSAKMVNKALQKTAKEHKDLKAKVDKFRLNILTPLSPTSDLSHTIDELGNLGVQCKMQEHLDRYARWKDYVKSMKKDLNDICNEIYTTEVLVNGLRLKGIVELRSIPKLTPLREEELKYIDSLTTKYKTMVSNFISLEEQIEHTMEEIKDLM